MIHYKTYFNGAVVFCNCDDPQSSAFWEYFHLNFGYLKLKKLISTHYEKDKFSYKLEYTGGNDSDLSVGVQSFLSGNGDFRSDECIELLKESDIVVTNPPFSLFRDFLAQLITYEKKFIILGNINAVSYNEVFPLIKDQKMWLGVSIHSGDREFRVPDDYPLNAAKCRQDATGAKYIRIKGVRWYTNLDTPQRHISLILYKKYSPLLHPFYDNYNAIEMGHYDKKHKWVGDVGMIPDDYSDTMGVPITFLDKYNPDQFEIIGLFKGFKQCDYKKGLICGRQTPYKHNNKVLYWTGPTLKQDALYARLLIKRRQHDN